MHRTWNVSSFTGAKLPMSEPAFTYAFILARTVDIPNSPMSLLVRFH
jgi:hypothetical protein